MKVLLFSGGIDSSAIAFWLRPDICVTIDYGQTPAAGELRAASALASALQLRHEIIHTNLSMLGSGQLADRPALPIASGPEWWPYRNQLLITIAGMKFVSLGVTEIVIGCVQEDSHLDGKQRFLKSIDAAMSAQEGHVRVAAPAATLSSTELVKISGMPTDLLGLTFSCHVHEFPCGVCRGCQKHAATIANLSLRDSQLPAP